MPYQTNAFKRCFSWNQCRIAEILRKDAGEKSIRGIKTNNALEKGEYFGYIFLSHNNTVSGEILCRWRRGVAAPLDAWPGYGGAALPPGPVLAAGVCPPGHGLGGGGAEADRRLFGHGP